MKALHIIFLALTVFLLSSCEEVINIDLNESDPKVVIEAILKDRPTGNQVTISQSGSYFEPGNYPVISNATVRLVDNEGNEEILKESSSEAGTYPILESMAEAGKTYSLEVEVDGEIYKATSEMQQPLAVDSVIFDTRNGPLVQDPAKNRVMIVQLEDPVGEDNFLLFEAEVNGELQPDLFLYDGRPTDGQRASVPFISLFLAKGDSVKLNTYSIEKQSYDYYSTLAGLVGSGFVFSAATPANPETNWSNGALGFFGTLAMSEMEVVVE